MGPETPGGAVPRPRRDRAVRRVLVQKRGPRRGTRLAEGIPRPAPEIELSGGDPGALVEPLAQLGGSGVSNEGVPANHADAGVLRRGLGQLIEHLQQL